MFYGKLPVFIPCLLLYACVMQAQPGNKNKTAAIQYIDSMASQLTRWNNDIWTYAEPSLQEYQSSGLLAGILEKQGFTVKRNVSGFPTMFIAEYGSGKPVIGLFGEYDADSNASNKIVPKREASIQGSYGHGGGHNVLGVGSLGAALAIRDLIQRGKLACTIRYYGTSAEGSIGAKAWLARDGYFNDLDLSLYWHPAPGTWASTGPWDALIDFDIIFSGKRTNTIRQVPGDSTVLTAMELLMPTMRAAREKMTAGIRINYALRAWDNNISYIPDTATLRVRIQCARQEGAMRLFDSIQKATAGISSRTGIKHTIHVSRAMHQFLPNVTAMQAVQQNMELLGPIVYTEQEQQFSKEMQTFLKQPPDGILDKIPAFSDQSKRENIYGYASDIGDASWIAPEIYFTVRSLPAVPMHQWPGTVFSGHSIGHKGMLQASKLLSMTIIDYVENKPLQERIRKDFLENSRGYRYASLLPAGPR